MVTFTVEDDAGNTANCDATVEVIDDSPPQILDCPADRSIIPDPSCMAVVPNLIPEVLADDNCDLILTVTQDPPAGTPIAGPTTLAVTITVEDDAALTDECITMITVDQTTLDPVVQLEGVTGDVTRCITFTLYDCDAMVSSAPISIDMDFVNGVSKTKFPIPCGDWDCVHAKDELHSLGTTVPAPIIDDQYKAFFIDSDQLLCGDANNDDLVDILDYGALFGQFLIVIDPNTPCTTPLPPPFHTDFTADGVIDSFDFQCIVSNFLEVSDPLDACCGIPLSAPNDGPLDQMRTSDLIGRYGPQARAADTNHDGLVNLMDMKNLAQRYNSHWPKRLDEIASSRQPEGNSGGVPIDD
jgi:hypothetical protein